MHAEFLLKRNYLPLQIRDLQEMGPFRVACNNLESS